MRIEASSNRNYQCPQKDNDRITCEINDDKKVGITSWNQIKNISLSNINLNITTDLQVPGYVTCRASNLTSRHHSPVNAEFDTFTFCHLSDCVYNSSTSCNILLLVISGQLIWVRIQLTRTFSKDTEGGGGHLQTIGEDWYGYIFKLIEKIGRDLKNWKGLLQQAPKF